MRFHIPALPGQPVRRSNSTCAFTQKVRCFADMMVPRGHEVLIYGEAGGEHAGEHIEVYPELPEPPPFNEAAWEHFNVTAALEINKIKEPGDFLCLIGGSCQKLLAELTGLRAIEFGIGYGGVFAQCKVFESYAWMHTTYGMLKGNSGADGEFFDAVIPAYFDPDEAPFREQKEDYVAYLGRMTWRKGVRIAEEACQAAGVKLYWAGGGDWTPDYGEQLGILGPDERWELMSKARCTFAPTIYIEPFGQVVTEAHLCGTPTITTDWGAFVETNPHGLTGWRCRMLHEFIDAITACDHLDPQMIRDFAIAGYSFEAVAPQYERYFTQVAALDADGWYAARPDTLLPLAPDSISDAMRMSVGAPKPSSRLGNSPGASFWRGR